VSNVKIGVFGDSYAECYPDIQHDYSWAKSLQEKKYNCSIFAKGGSSTWYSLGKLKENIDDYDVIIFSFSYPYRFPFFDNQIPVNFQANLFTPIAQLERSKNLDKRSARLLKKHQLNFWNYFSTDLLNHIHKGIVFEVNELCKNKNKKLIALFPFYTAGQSLSDFPLSHLIDKNFPVIYGIKKITDEEFYFLNKNNQIELFDKQFHKWDLRQNHLTSHNLEIYLQMIEKAIFTDDILRIDLTAYQKLNLNFNFSIENIAQHILPELHDTVKILFTLEQEKNS